MDKKLITSLDIEDDVVYENSAQDISGHVEFTAGERAYTSEQKRGDMWRVASIPDVVIVDMIAKHGFNIYKDRDYKKLASLIELHYPYLKTMNVNLVGLVNG
jgi:hypothetical protein